jgi:hypothetical protein
VRMLLSFQRPSHLFRKVFPSRTAHPGSTGPRRGPTSIAPDRRTREGIRGPAAGSCAGRATPRAAGCARRLTRKQAPARNGLTRERRYVRRVEEVLQTAR